MAKATARNALEPAGKANACPPIPALRSNRRWPRVLQDAARVLVRRELIFAGVIADPGDCGTAARGVMMKRRVMLGATSEAR